MMIVTVWRSHVTYIQVWRVYVSVSLLVESVEIMKRSVTGLSHSGPWKARPSGSLAPRLPWEIGWILPRGP